MKLDTCSHSAMVVGAATGLAGFLIHNGPRILTKTTNLPKKITTTFDICYLFHCIRLYFMFMNWWNHNNIWYLLAVSLHQTLFHVHKLVSTLLTAMSSTINFLSQTDECCKDETHVHELEIIHKNIWCFLNLNTIWNQSK